MIFVIYGEESFLMEQKLQSLKKEYDCNEDNMNISTYRANEDSLEEVYEDLITPPFLTDKKMVVLKNPYFLTTKKVKKDNNELEYFEKCLINSEEVIFVIYHVGKDFDERKKIVKNLRKQAQFFEIDKVNDMSNLLVQLRLAKVKPSRKVPLISTYSITITQKHSPAKHFFRYTKPPERSRCLSFCLVCGHLAVLHGGREHDLRPRPSKMLQLADKLVELNGTNKKALNEHGVMLSR